jgi:hypothetical protein
MAGRSSPNNLKPIATRRDGERASPSSGSGVASPKGRPVPGAAGESDSPGMGSDSSSPWRRFFRGGARYPASDVDSFNASPRNLMGFSPKASSTSQSHVSTPVKRKYGGGGGGGSGSGRDYGGGQITSYGGAGHNPAAHGAAGAMMMSLAEELLTKKGLSLKDLTEEQEEYAETGDKVRWWAGGGGGGCGSGWDGSGGGGGAAQGPRRGRGCRQRRPAAAAARVAAGRSAARPRRPWRAAGAERHPPADAPRRSRPASPPTPRWPSPRRSGR